MPRTRNPYPTEFWEHIIALARSGAARRVWRGSLSHAQRHPPATVRACKAGAAPALTSPFQEDASRLIPPSPPTYRDDRKSVNGGKMIYRRGL